MRIEKMFVSYSVRKPVSWRGEFGDYYAVHLDRKAGPAIPQEGGTFAIVSGGQMGLYGTKPKAWFWYLYMRIIKVPYWNLKGKYKNGDD